MIRMEKTHYNKVASKTGVDNCGHNEIVKADSYTLTLIIEKLETENKQLKELINKYEEEQNTTFQTWLKTIQQLQSIKTYCEELILENQKHLIDEEFDKLDSLFKTHLMSTYATQNDLCREILNKLGEE